MFLMPNHTTHLAGRPITYPTRPTGLWHDRWDGGRRLATFGWRYDVIRNGNKSSRDIDAVKHLCAFRQILRIRSELVVNSQPKYCRTGCGPRCSVATTFTRGQHVVVSRDSVKTTMSCFWPQKTYRNNCYSKEHEQQILKYCWRIITSATDVM